MPDNASADTNTRIEKVLEDLIDAEMKAGSAARNLTEEITWRRIASHRMQANALLEEKDPEILYQAGKAEAEATTQANSAARKNEKCQARLRQATQAFNKLQQEYLSSRLMPAGRETLS